MQELSVERHSATITPTRATHSAEEVQRTRWLFFTLCLYLIAQCYMIPVIGIGPSWSIWPRFADVVMFLFLLAYIHEARSYVSISAANKEVLVFFLFFIGLSLLSFIVYLIFGHAGKGANFGIYQMYFLIKFLWTFWISIQIPLPEERIRILQRIADFALVFVCVGVAVTYFSLVPLWWFVAHLPQTSDIAGPWSSYVSDSEYTGTGFGTIGYNYAYTALQIIMLVALRMHLRGGKNAFSDNILLMISIVAVFLSSSRAGLAAILLFALLYWIRRPLYAILAGSTALVALVIAIFLLVQIGFSASFLDSATIETTLGRQETLLQAGNADNLSGRDTIWASRIAFLDAQPLRWVIGSGFGSAIDSGSFAHMLFLHVILEMGVVGLCVFFLLFARILYLLHRYESGSKPIFWVTLALLFSSMTQETFYPAPALGHFIGFYLCTVAIALRSQSDRIEASS